MIDHGDAFLEWLRQQQLPRTEPYPCPYLNGLEARQYGFATPELPAKLYHLLMDRGFRRTGEIFYAMDCPTCQRCRPLRVPVAGFRPSRSQRRTLARNADVRTEVREPQLDARTVDLYQRYLEHQHPGTPQEADEESLQTWLYSDVVDSLEVRYLVDDELLGVSIVDRSDRSLSSVYHFFEPRERQRRIGVLSVLREIELARAWGIPHYYLGYWVEGAATMQYKAEYRPHELLIGDSWVPAPPPNAPDPPV